MRTRVHALIATCVALAIAALAGAEGMTLKQLAELRSVGSAVSQRRSWGKPKRSTQLSGEVCSLSSKV